MASSAVCASFLEKPSLVIARLVRRLSLHAGIASALLILAINAASLTACSRLSSNSPHAGAVAHAGTVHGVLRIGDMRQPDNLNPMLSFGQIATDLSMLWAAYLFRWSDRNELVPELATQVPTLHNGGISADGLTITYRLRRGVRWQDGAPFTADDVIFTWQQVMNPRNNIQSRVGYDAIDWIKKVGNLTLVVHLKKRFAPFVETFFTPADATYCILPRHLLSGSPDINHAAYNNLPIGTGPFRVVEDDKVSEIRMEANPGYWRGPPRLREVVYRILPDDDTIGTQFQTHEIDLRIGAPAAQAAALRAQPGIVVYAVPFTAFESLDFNTSHAVVSDARVRQALHYALDVRRMGAALTRGQYLASGSDQPPFLWAHNPEVMGYPYDPSRASRLLDEAEWKLGSDGVRAKNGQRLELNMVSATGSTLASAIDVLVQHDWKKVGVAVNIKQYPTDLLGGPDGIYRTGKFDLFFDSWSNGTDPDDSQIFMCDEQPPEGTNYFHFCNRSLDAAENVALTEYSLSKRKAAYARIQEILAEQDPIIVLWFDVRQDIASADLRGYKPAHAVTTFWNPWEWSI